MEYVVVGGFYLLFLVGSAYIAKCRQRALHNKAIRVRIPNQRKEI